MSYDRSTRTELGEKFNEGARRLWAFLGRKKLSRTRFALQAGVSRSALHRWLYGDSRPDRTEAGVLHDLANIDPALWDEAPRESFTVPASRDASPHS